MEGILLSCLFLMSMSGALAATDMEGNVFLFPKESATSYVILTPKTTSPLSSFTVSFRYRKELTRYCSLFSSATSKTFNDILISKENTTHYKVFVGDESVTFRGTDDTPDWEHLCASWDSSTGVVTLWINGKSLPRKTMKKGYSVNAQPIIILGQEQDSYGGGFDINQSFVGEITDVNMWDSVLSPSDVQLALANDNWLCGTIIDWKSMYYELKDDVIIQRKLEHSSYYQCDGTCRRQTESKC
ncbi:serum amyloid P-component-like [Rhinatrema bivittatum]|uniref:serum amyloid P-component-like n=1 Tax=Rhinatrema bivittatum TaxID=194408 RepID=UPI001127A143|nr:serum amyloid P-component-like [Rhinatrema bivittatum]XP_029436390.1 serum amyloid P-component-like [Rhinatrema bivittatum]